MKIYDLMWGNFDITQVVNKQVPFLKAYYPFYLYRSGYSIIPDATNLSRAFIKKQSDLPLFQNIQKTTCYLISNQCQGYVTKEENPNLDVPIIHKTFSVSFDVVMLEPLLDPYSQTIDLLSISVRSTGWSVLNNIKVTMTLDITPNSTNLGTLNLNVNDRIQDVSNVFQISSQPNEPSTDHIIHNPDVFNRTFAEKNVNLRQILSKQTVTLTVNSSFKNFYFSNLRSQIHEINMFIDGTIKY